MGEEILVYSRCLISVKRTVPDQATEIFPNTRLTVPRNLIPMYFLVRHEFSKNNMRTIPLLTPRNFAVFYDFFAECEIGVK